MDAEDTVDWIEQHSVAVAEWSSRTMGKKDCWDTDRKGEMSELNPRGPNVQQLDPVVCKQRGYSILRTMTTLTLHTTPDTLRPKSVQRGFSNPRMPK